MMRQRVTKLEKLVAERMSNCPGCGPLPPLILIPPSPDTEGGAPPAARTDASVRCRICGTARRRPVIKVWVAGLPEPAVEMT